MPDDDRNDPVQQAKTLKKQILALSLGNTILRAEIKRLEELVVVAERKARIKYNAMMSPAVFGVFITLESATHLLR